MHLNTKNGTKTPGGACGLIMGPYFCSVLMESPLIANGAEISSIHGFVKIIKIERKVQAPRYNISISAALFQIKLM
jgi:hypothetical protein